MNDLVNRLRGQYAVGPDGVYGTRDFADFIPPISLEAADRITELEAQLASSQSKSQWVSVEDRLPEDAKPVIIHGGCGHYSHSNGKWYTNMERLNNGDYRQISWIVTEWQHLPEPSQ